MINTATVRWLALLLAACPTTVRVLQAQEHLPEPTGRTMVVLTSPEQIRAVETDWSSGQYQARLEGSVVYVNPPLHRLYLLVDDHGIQVNLSGDAGAYHLGERVQVVGTVMDGEPTLRLRDCQVSVLGAGPLPAPKPVTAERLMAGHDAFRYARLRGMVRDLYAHPAGLYLILSEGFQPIEVTINAPGIGLPEDWLDAELEVTGIPFPLHRPTAPRVRALWFHCYSTNDVRIVRRGIARRFDGRPILSIADALRLPGNTQDRIRLAGTVTGHRPGVGYFIDDGTGAMFVDSTLSYLRPPATAQRITREAQTPLQAGERIEVIGVPYNVRALTPSLIESEYRRIGPAKPIQPLSVTLSDLKEGRHAGRLVTLHGHLVDQRAWQSSDLIRHQAFVFRVEDEVFQARWDSESQMHWALQDGRYYSITGVNAAEGSSTQKQSVFQLHLRTPEDVMPAVAPLYWQRQEARRTIVIAAGVAALAGLWLLSYRFKVRLLENNIAARTLELRESERKFRTLYESAGNAVVVHDRDRILDCNPATLRMLGYARREDLIGQSPDQLSARATGGAHEFAPGEQTHLEAAQTKGVHQFEWLARRADGTSFPVEVYLTTVQLNGQPAFQAVLHDITERKRAEAERERSLAHQKQLSELKSRFISMVSHEFRTPLGIIMSSAEILDSYLDRLTAAERRSHLQDVTHSAQHMSELMEEVLLLGRVEAGKMRCCPEPMDLDAFCRKVVADVTSTTGGRCRITLALAPDLHAARGDESLLRHIFTNLLSNAVKYSQPGSAVALTVEAQGEFACFIFRDAGIGIPAADHDQIFQAFHRARNVGQISGTGLGLVIARHCTQLHGGRISFQSREGHGTEFTVQLPLFGARAFPDKAVPH